MMKFKEFAELFPHHSYHELVDTYHGKYFRDNAVVGDGATLHVGSDSHACTIIARTPKTLTLRRCTAIRTDNNGMSDCQDYRYEENERGQITKVYWSKKLNRFVHGCMSVTADRNEYFDFSF